jgi:hypothetical protein
MGEHLWRYLSLIRRPPAMYFVLKENPILTLLVVYVLLPRRFPLPEGDEDLFPWEDSEETQQVQHARRTSWTIVDAVGLASTGVVLVVCGLISSRLLRERIFPALNRGVAKTMLYVSVVMSYMQKMTDL